MNKKQYLLKKMAESIYAWNIVSKRYDLENIECLRSVFDNILNFSREITKEEVVDTEEKEDVSVTLPEGYIFIKNWPRDEKHGWLGATSLKNYIAVCYDLRAIAKKAGHSWTIRPMEVWEYFKNCNKGMHSAIKNRQRKVAHLWK